MVPSPPTDGTDGRSVLAWLRNPAPEANASEVFWPGCGESPLPEPADRSGEGLARSAGVRFNAGL
jgi:hypothetical protein